MIQSAKIHTSVDFRSTGGRAIESSVFFTGDFIIHDRFIIIFLYVFSKNIIEFRGCIYIFVPLVPLVRNPLLQLSLQSWEFVPLLSLFVPLDLLLSLFCVHAGL